MSEGKKLPKRDASKFIAMLEEARSLHLSGDLEAAMMRFESVLQVVTPDDSQIEMAMILNQGKGVSENREADSLDSMIRSELVYVLLGLKRPEEAEHHARIALYLDLCLYGELHTNVSQCHHDLGICHRDLAATRKTNEDIDIAFNSFKESEGIDKRIRADPPVFKRRRERLSFYFQFGFLVNAAKHAKWLADNRPEKDNIESLVEDLNFAGQRLQDLGEHELALKYTKSAINEQQEAVGSVPDYLYANLGYLYLEQGHISDAQLQFERSRRFTRKELETQINPFKRLINKKEMLHDIFISYSSVDDNIVNILVKALEGMGASIWTFKKAPNWQVNRRYDQIIKEMQTKIAISNMVVIVVSDTAVGSDYVFEELLSARRNDIPIAAWYPQGNPRLVPKALSSRPNIEDSRRYEFLKGLMRRGVVYTYFGTGLRPSKGGVIAHALLKLFLRLYPSHKLSRELAGNSKIQSALDGTITWPMYVGADGRPIEPKQLRNKQIGSK